jgi:hypothetical protein
MKKTYRISQSKFGILLYATPVEKQSMFLINAPSILHAEIYKHLLDFGVLSSPLQSPQLYDKRGLHTDGITEIYDLRWSTLQLKLLPQRGSDLNRANILENLFAKKFEKLFLNMDDKDELIKDMQFRFSQQQLCSECQKLGIGNTELVTWFAALDKWSSSTGQM